MPDNPSIQIDVIADAQAFVQSETARVTASQQSNAQIIATIQQQIAALSTQLAAAQKLDGLFATQTSELAQLQTDITALTQPAPAQ